MKIKLKWIAITFSAIIGFILLALACGYSYFCIGFPPMKNGIERLNLITHTKLPERVVYYGTTGSFEDWQEYFKFNATKDEVENIVIQLKLKKENIYSVSPDFYWWSPESGNQEIYSRDLGSSYYYLHYDTVNSIVHFADVHF